MIIKMDYGCIYTDMLWIDSAQVVTWHKAEHPKGEPKPYILLHVMPAQTASTILSTIHFPFALHLQGELPTSLPAGLCKLRK